MAILNKVLEEVPALQQHYTVPQVAAAWGMSGSKVRSLFRNEPGVLKFDSPTRMLARGKYKRRYCEMRIPESVMVRVHAKLTQ